MIETMDLCSLLGNALDNAIESSLKIADTEKRLINLRIAQKANFILFSLENYVEAPPSFEGGLPKTTKSDQQQHGYGLKSIDYIANKYNGSLTVGVKDNWFSIKVLLPLT
ncbi:ATP-binding protein [Loigolactobacillus coryniformis]|nr:ATP-binding protein [Loigolactobacillus coryniformis]